MATWYGFFNSNNQDRVYDAGDFASYFALLISNGVFYDTASNLEVTVGTNLTVDIAAGAANINGYMFRNDAVYNLTLANANGVNPRIDLVVLRWSLLNRMITIESVTGTADPNPAPPPVTRTPDTYEICLAEVRIGASAINLQANSVTDKRADSAVCGLVNSHISALYE